MTPATTVRIKFPANLRVGYCQIPEAEFDPEIHELWEEPGAPAGEGIGTDSGDQFSDDQLRAAIEAATGKKPHHKAGREKLIEQFNTLNADPAVNVDLAA